MKRTVFALIIITTAFSCKDKVEFDYPLIQTGEVTDVDSTGAVFHARIIDAGKDNISEYGFVWGLKSNPEINSSIVLISESPLPGVIREKVTYDLCPDTVYYVRAFARNDNYITYGKEVSFRSIGSYPPEIFDFSPKEGAEGTRITILGNNFSNALDGNVVKFGKVYTTIIEASKEKLVVNLPGNISISGIFRICITTANQTVCSDSTFYVPGVTIYGFSPQKIMGGKKISVHAGNFSEVLTDNELLIGFKKAEIYDIKNDTLFAYVPYNAEFGGEVISLIVKNKIAYSIDTLFIINPWSKIDNIQTFSRIGASGFSINKDIFIGLGKELGSLDTRYIDLWRYNINSDSWTKCSDFPGQGRVFSVAFSISGKGYIGLGHYYYEKYINALKDLYEFDPDKNTWIKKASFPGKPRQYPVCVVIGNKAYIGLGLTENWEDLNDVWEYDPETDKWTQKADFGGTKRYNATVFTVDGKAYVGLGYSWTARSSLKDFWQYNPVTDTWGKIADFPGQNPGDAVVSFSLGTDGYIGLGGDSGFRHFWLYDTKTGKWYRIPDLIFNGRYHAIGYSIDSKGYICSGYCSSGKNNESIIILNPSGLSK
jgi:N-acetylneuraminic acid mutarotase